MIIYTANKNEIKELDITNMIATKSIVYINGIIYDDVILAESSFGVPNLRVLELDLKNGDIVSAKDNELITYKIK
jgi:hypothetical protein